MKTVRWHFLKNERLKKLRGVGFEDILGWNHIQTLQHPLKSYEQIMLYERNGRIWAVPIVETEREIVLKTLYPSRKFTKMYKQGRL